MEGAAHGKTYKMKGHTLPGIKQDKSSNLAAGRAKSSTFQRGIGDYKGEGSFALQVDPMMNPAMAAQPIQQVPGQTPLMDHGLSRPAKNPGYMEQFTKRKKRNIEDRTYTKIDPITPKQTKLMPVSRPDDTIMTTSGRRTRA